MEMSKAQLVYIKIWGCDAYVKHIESDKVEVKFDKRMFVEYPKKTFRYLFYIPIEKKLFISRHIVFLENEFFLKETLEV